MTDDTTVVCGSSQRWRAGPVTLLGQTEERRNVNIYTLIGLVGVVAYIGSYALLQLKLLDGNGVPYTVANLAAASMVLISMVEQFNLASALIQIAWIGFGVVGLGLRLVRWRLPLAAAAEQMVAHRPATS